MLLYACSISLSFDVKSLCIKIIDVICSRHTNLVMTLRIDTELISYLSEILIPKHLSFDLELIRKKRIHKLISDAAMAGNIHCS